MRDVARCPLPVARGAGDVARGAFRLHSRRALLWCGRLACALSPTADGRGQDAHTTRGRAGGTLAALLLASAVPAAAQVALRAEVSATRIGVDDQLELTIVIEGRSVDVVEEPVIGALENLTVVSRPSVSTQVSFVNGTVTQARRYLYVLQPGKVGAARVGPVRCTRT